GGAAYCWGYNESGQLGVGTSEGPHTCRYGSCSADPVPVVTGLRWVSITAGGAHTCGLTPGGEAYCWGSNAYGQLGIGTAGPETCGSYACSTLPVPVACCRRRSRTFQAPRCRYRAGRRRLIPSNRPRRPA